MIEFTCNPFQSMREELTPKPPAANFIEETLPQSGYSEIYQPPLVQANLMAPLSSSMPLYGQYYNPPRVKENSRAWLWLILFVLLGGFIYVIYKDEIDRFFKKLWSRINL